jgi:hypothetical protein
VRHRAHRFDGCPGLAKDGIDILVVVPSQDSLVESTLSIETASTISGQGPFLMTHRTASSESEMELDA